MPSCCVKSCPNRGGIIGVTFHKVPFKLKETWYEILNKHGMKNLSVHMVICSEHFKPEDLDRDGFRTVLKKDAVPSLYLDRPTVKAEDNKRMRMARRQLAGAVKLKMEKEKKDKNESSTTVKTVEDANKNVSRPEIPKVKRDKRRFGDLVRLWRNPDRIFLTEPIAQTRVVNSVTIRRESVKVSDMQKILRSR